MWPQTVLPKECQNSSVPLSPRKTKRHGLCLNPSNIRHNLGGRHSEHTSYPTHERQNTLSMPPTPSPQKVAWDHSIPGDILHDAKIWTHLDCVSWGDHGEKGWNLCDSVCDQQSCKLPEGPISSTAAGQRAETRDDAGLHSQDQLSWGGPSSGTLALGREQNSCPGERWGNSHGLYSQYVCGFSLPGCTQSFWRNFKTGRGIVPLAGKP